MRTRCACLLSLLLPSLTCAINAPQWERLAEGDYIDTANIKTDPEDVAAYIKHANSIALYEVDCKGDRIRVHSDIPRYRAVPVEGGGQVVVSDDGYRTVLPGSREALIENTICELVQKREQQRLAEQAHVECERAMKDIAVRVRHAEGRLTWDEAICLRGMAGGERPKECSQAMISPSTDIVEYLHLKGIFLECE
jgi:hypothetical protein